MKQFIGIWLMCVCLLQLQCQTEAYAAHKNQSLSGTLKKATFHVDGMTCGACERLIENTFKPMPGIVSVKANHKTKEVTVEFDSNTLQEKDIEQKLSELYPK